MEINTKDDGALEFSKVYSPIRIIADKKESLTISIRDNGGFEIAYEDHVLILKKGEVGLKPEGDD